MLTILISLAIGVVVALIRHRQKKLDDKLWMVYLYGTFSLLIGIILIFVITNPLMTEKQEIFNKAASKKSQLLIFAK